MPMLEELEATRKVKADMKSQSLTVEYIIKQIDDAMGALSLIPPFRSIFAGSPPGYTFYLDSWDVEELSRHGPLTNRAVKLTLTYKTPEGLASKDEDEGGESVEYEVSLAQEHIIRTNLGFGDGQEHLPESRNFGPFIGVTDTDVEGVDILVPKQTMTINKLRDTFSNQYRLTIAQLAGKVNRESFRGYDPGQVLYAGAHVEERGTGKVRVSHRFLINPNAPSDREVLFEYATPDPADPGGVILNQGRIDKDPWQYVWFISKRRANTDLGFMEVLIDSGHLTTVYDNDVFADLELDEDA